MRYTIYHHLPQTLNLATEYGPCSPDNKPTPRFLRGMGWLGAGWDGLFYLCAGDGAGVAYYHTIGTPVALTSLAFLLGLLLLPFGKETRGAPLPA